MKPINEMSLLELADALETAYYAYQDELEALSKRLRELHELTRWIPVEERLPSKEDADINGNVLIRERENESPHRIYRVVGPYEFVTASPNYYYTITHWRRIDTP